MQFIAKTFFGLEEILAKELIEMGANDVEIQNRAVSFSGDKALLYKANLGLRTASRILVPIATFSATNADEVYDAAKKIDWSTFMTLQNTFVINSTVNSLNFTNSQFVSYRVKDAIADFFMERENKRPSVRVTNPDIYINVHISHDECSISLDSTGESLHKRGYRAEQTEAPISEALAAGMLLMAKWDGKKNFIDPMCGSGTFLIEAALIALNINPGIYRTGFAFEKWMDFDKELFSTIYDDDSDEREFEFKIYGSDRNKIAIKIAEDNIKSAGLSKYIQLDCVPVADLKKPEGACLMVTNPPYGERIQPDDLFDIYRQLGTTLKRQFADTNAWVISASTECLASVGMRPSNKVKLINGKIDCEFWQFEIFEGKRNDFVTERAESGYVKEPKITRSFDRGARSGGFSRDNRSSDRRDSRSGGGFSRDNRSSDRRDSRSGGGFSRDNRSSDSRDSRSGGGFSRDNRSSDRRDSRSGGGFSRDNRSSDSRDSRSGGGFSRDNRSSDRRDSRSGGGFSRDNRSSDSRDSRSGGGFSRDNRSSDRRDSRSGGGFSRDNRSSDRRDSRSGGGFSRDSRSSDRRDSRSGGGFNKERR